MKVDKKFAPVTITLEYEEEATFLIEVLRRAQNRYDSHGFFNHRKYDDPFMQKCRYLEERLK